MDRVRGGSLSRLCVVHLIDRGLQKSAMARELCAPECAVPGTRIIEDVSRSGRPLVAIPPDYFHILLSADSRTMFAIAQTRMVRGG